MFVALTSSHNVCYLLIPVFLFLLNIQAKIKVRRRADRAEQKSNSSLWNKVAQLMIYVPNWWIIWIIINHKSPMTDPQSSPVSQISAPRPHLWVMFDFNSFTDTTESHVLHTFRRVQRKSAPMQSWRVQYLQITWWLNNCTIKTWMFTDIKYFCIQDFP